MKKTVFLAVICWILLPLSGLGAYEERTISLAADAMWRMAERREGLSEEASVRPGTVLMLSSTRRASLGNVPVRSDLALTFDEARAEDFADLSGNYSVTVRASVAPVGRQLARSGQGAALFHGQVPGILGTGSPIVLSATSSSALFAPSRSIGDFSVEFYLNPLTMENGGEVLRWAASRMSTSVPVFQHILVGTGRNRLNWRFSGFFNSPDRDRTMDIELEGQTPLVPGTWSHHLLRFDSTTGLVEYLLNGVPEAVAFATSTGREGGEVYTPHTGFGGNFVLGGSFSGMMDEFRIHGGMLPERGTFRYPPDGGRIETSAIDLGTGNNRVLELKAQGGRTRTQDRLASRDFRENGDFLFDDDSQMQFFVRASNNPFHWPDPWQPVIPGTAIAGQVVGRYVQIAVSFYPSADGEGSPYLKEVGLTFLRDEPPAPPSRLVAAALDGSVQLTWRQSPNQNVLGYLVYYGTSEGELFGEGAVLGPSPIHIGPENSVVIEGLQNGKLYFFRVAAYSEGTSPWFLGSSVPAPGEFSNEARARPLPR